MTLKKVHVFECNLCGAESEPKDGAAKPYGWASMIKEDHNLDKEFTDKHVCSNCCVQINEQYRKDREYGAD